MSEQLRRVVEVDPVAARSRNRKNVYILGGICVIAAAVGAGLFLVPRGDIVERQLNRELTANAAAGTSPTVAPTTDGRGQVLAGPHGTTFIIGNVGKMVGLNVKLQDIVDARSPDAFPEVILLRGVEVQTVPGDQVFSVGISPANSVLVKIVEPTQPGNLGENALVVRPGQKVAISGTVERINSLNELKKTFGVTGYEAGKLGNTSLVIRAHTVQILEQ